MQNRSETFLRAANNGGFGLYGDPERWGSETSLSLTANELRTTEQLIRAQCADLWATSWDLLLTWAQVGGDTLDPDQQALTIESEITIGVGQATSSISWVPLAQNARIGQSPFLGLTRGTADPTNPFHGAALITIPATSIAARINMGFQSQNPAQAQFLVSLMCAPRVGVP